MSTTLNSANEDLSAEDIRRLMDVIRHRMADEAVEVAAGARQLGNWKFYIRNFPVPVLAATAFLGFLAVPRRVQILSPDEATLRKLAKSNRLVVEAQPQGTQKPGLVDTMLTLAGNMLLRAGIAYAGQHVGKIFGEQAAQPQVGELHQ